MADWGAITNELEMLLKLRNYPIAYKRLEDAAELETIRKVRRLNRFMLFCQLPALVRNRGWTVGVTAQEGISPRCARIHGLASPTEKSKAEESAQLSTTWFASPEEAMRQQEDYPRIPPGEALVLAPLASGKFEPDVVLIYGNPAQLMMILCGLQKIRYERFEFFFIGEGACADSLAQCYTSGRPSIAIPCFGERRFGEVLDDEMVLALPPALVETAVEGLRKLSKVGLRLPIPFHGAEFDPSQALAMAYPPEPQHRKS